MFSRTRHLFIITLFAVAHLAVHPLTNSASCQSKGVSAMSCGCCSVDSGSTACGGCCSDSGQDENEPASSDEDGYKSGCHCSVTPPVPLPQHPGDSALAELGCGAALQRVDENPTLNSVWPSLSTRAARAPNPPPWVVSKTCSVFTQVYRL